MVAVSVLDSSLNDSIEKLPFLSEDLSDATRYIYYFGLPAVGESKDIVVLFESNGMCMLRIYSTGFLSYKHPKAQAAREAECLELDRRSPDYVKKVIEIASLDLPSRGEMEDQFINAKPLVDSLVTSDMNLLSTCLALAAQVVAGEEYNALSSSEARVVAFDGKYRVDFCTKNELRNAKPLLTIFDRLLQSIQ